MVWVKTLSLAAVIGFALGWTLRALFTRLFGGKGGKHGSGVAD